MDCSTRPSINNTTPNTTVPVPNTTDPAPADASPPRTLSPQDKAMLAYITDSAVFIGVAGTDSEIRPLLESRGYDAADFALGNTLVAAARKAVQTRADSMGEQSEATVLQLSADEQARDDYAQFRKIARASFTGQADRLALGLNGNVPKDLAQFITVAHASDTAAGLPPQADKATKRGYSPAVLAPLIAALDAFTVTAADQDEAQGDAIGDTAKRDAAYAALREFMKELKGVAKGTLRGQPGLLAKLKL